MTASPPLGPPYRTAAPLPLARFRVRPRADRQLILAVAALLATFVGILLWLTARRFLCLCFFVPFGLPGLRSLSARMLTVYEHEIVVSRSWPFAERVLPLRESEVELTRDFVAIRHLGARFHLDRAAFTREDEFEALRALLQKLASPPIPG